MPALWMSGTPWMAIIRMWCNRTSGNHEIVRRRVYGVRDVVGREFAAGGAGELSLLRQANLGQRPVLLRVLPQTGTRLYRWPRTGHRRNRAIAPAQRHEPGESRHRDRLQLG